MTDELVTHDPSSDTYRAEYPQDEPTGLTETIVFAVAQIESRDPAELDSLGRVVDTDALESLFDTGRASTALSTTFRYCGFVVTVRSDGTITFERSD